MLTNLFLRCVPQAGTPIERAGHLQVSMALLGNAFELPCPLAMLPCELAAGQDLLRLLQLWRRLQCGVGLCTWVSCTVWACTVAPRSGGVSRVGVRSRNLV